jgi:hypothetical protein
LRIEVTDEPPVSGSSVSMVSCAVCVVLAASLTVALEKWQVTPVGSEPHPRPMVSEKLSRDFRVTVSVAF